MLVHDLMCDKNFKTAATAKLGRTNNTYIEMQMGNCVEKPNRLATTVMTR